jgi:hypothetical protein
MRLLFLLTFFVFAVSPAFSQNEPPYTPDTHEGQKLINLIVDAYNHFDRPRVAVGADFYITITTQVEMHTTLTSREQRLTVIYDAISVDGVVTDYQIFNREYTPDDKYIEIGMTRIDDELYIRLIDSRDNYVGDWLTVSDYEELAAELSDMEPFNLQAYIQPSPEIIKEIMVIDRPEGSLLQADYFVHVRFDPAGLEQHPLFSETLSEYLPPIEQEEFLGNLDFQMVYGIRDSKIIYMTSQVSTSREQDGILARTVTINVDVLGHIQYRPDKFKLIVP